MDHQPYDLIVFGGGNAITVATKTAKAGMSVALIERGPLGGTCTHRGCIPSKLLIGYADAAEHVRDAARFRLEAKLEGIDTDGILEETFGYTNRFDALIEEDLPQTLDLFRGEGAFADDRTLEVNGTRLRSDKIVLATGSRPRRPDTPGLDGLPYWTSDDVFSMSRMPRSITIAGGGYIGCELAHFFHGVGVDTVLVHRGSELLAREDAQIRARFQEGFTKRVTCELDTTVSSVSHDGARFRIRLSSGAVRESEALLFALGRVPNTETINIENTSLAPNGGGFVESDGRLRTSVDGIYALGDVAGRYMFTHAANFEAEWLADQLIEGRNDTIEYGPMPHAVFTSPEVAGVGATEQELKDRGVAYLKGTQTFEGVTKGRAIKEAYGLCKILVGRDGAILGCHIVGHQASILLHEVIPVMKWRNDIRSLTEIIHIHPSLSEVVRGAARNAAREIRATT